MSFKPPRSTRTRLRTFVAASAVILTAGVASGCGEDRSNLLPGDTANEISSNLDRVRQLAGSGDCFGALTAAQEVTRQVEGLGAGVDRRLKRSLRDGVTQLVLTVQENCEATEGTVTEEPAEVPETTTTGPTGDTGTGETEETPETGGTGPTDRQPEDQPGNSGNPGGDQGNDPGGNQPATPPSNGGGNGTTPGGSGTGGVGPGTGGVGPPAG